MYGLDGAARLLGQLYSYTARAVASLAVVKRLNDRFDVVKVLKIVGRIDVLWSPSFKP